MLFRTVTIFLLLISFIEGGVLMAFEILSAKLYTPYLGSSIYVWTSILTLTLAGLALGYKIGGRLSLNRPEKKLNFTLIIAAITIILSIYTTPPILEALLHKDVKTAAIIGGLGIIFIPITALGTVSPLIVGIFHTKGYSVPFSTGLVYGVGTLGGILLLLITTFLFIPSIGVEKSLLFMGGLLILAALISFTFKIKKHA